MREPPRLGTSGNSNNYSDRPFDNSPHQPYAPYPPHSPRSGGRGSIRTILLAFGITFGVIFLVCGGIALVTYRQFTSPNTMSEEFRANREQPGDKLPESMSQSIATSAPVDMAEHGDIAELLTALQDGYLADGSEVIDADRVFEEMKACGLGVGLNPVNKVMITLQMSEMFNVPELGYQNTVVALDWLKPDEEVRVSLLTHNNWDPYPKLILLYLVKTDDQWLLYDHHDVMLPLSEVQLQAARIAQPLATQSTYYYLWNDLDEIQNDYEINDIDKPNRLIEAYRRRKLSGPLQLQAQCITLQYLLEHEEVKPLEEFLQLVSPGAFPADHFARSILASRKEEKALAFEHLTTMMQGLGWHPAAAIMAGRVAESEEQRQQAIAWLERSIEFATKHAPSAHVYFDLADGASLSRLVDKYRTREDGQAKLIALLTNSDDASFCERLSSATDLQNLELVKQYCELVKAANKQESGAIVATTQSILAHPLLSAVDAQLSEMSTTSLSEFTWDTLLGVADQVEDLEQLIAVAPDPKELYSRISGQILYQLDQSNGWEAKRALMLKAAEHTDLSEVPETRVALAICNLRTGNVEAAYDELLQVIERQRGGLLAIEETPSYSFVTFQSAAEAAVELGRWKEFVDVVEEPETAYLILMSFLSLNPDLNSIQVEVDDWYAQETSAQQYWRDYYAAHRAFQMGDWDQADQSLKQALQQGVEDVRWGGGELRSTTYSFAPFSDDLSEWCYLRTEWAARMGRMADLIARVIDEEGDVPSYVWPIYDLVPADATPEQLNEIIQKLSNDVLGIDERWLENELRVRAAALSHDYLEARRQLELLAQRNELTKDDFIELALSDPQIAELLSTIATEDDDRLTVGMLQAILTKDPELAVQSLNTLPAYDYSRQKWGYDLRVLKMKEAGIWSKVNTILPASAQSIARKYQANGMILLDEPASQKVDQIAQGISAKLGQTLVPIESLERFPGAVAAWSTPTSAGELLVVAYDEPLPSEQRNLALERLRENSNGFVCFSLMQTSYGRSPSRQLRQLALACHKQLNGKAYVDVATGSWFDGETWPEQLADAIDHGVNRAAPFKFEFPMWQSDAAYYGSVSKQFVSRGMMVEELRVTQRPEPLTEEDDHEFFYELTEKSYLVPALSSGDVIGD